MPGPAPAWQLLPGIANDLQHSQAWAKGTGDGGRGTGDGGRLSAGRDAFNARVDGTETKSSDICTAEIRERSRDQEYHRDTSYPD